MSDFTAPKVFLSHASEDKERFVRGFAERLRQLGIDAWYDGWEILPGDNLINKIFEEGLKQAQYVVIVLSKISVQKPWVREELNVSLVKKIQGESRIIPVIIDEDFEIPEALRTILWQKVSDVNNYDDVLRQIVKTIFGVSDKPSLGQPPSYVQLGIDQLPGLSPTDTRIFLTACEVALSGESEWVNTQHLQAELERFGLPINDIQDSLYIIQHRHLLEIEMMKEDSLGLIKVTTHGFENYGKFYIPDFDDLVNRVFMIIFNDNLYKNGDIADRNGITPIMAYFILDMLVQRKYITVLKFMGNIRDSVHMNEITPLGRRFASQVR